MTRKKVRFVQRSLNQPTSGCRGYGYSYDKDGISLTQAPSGAADDEEQRHLLTLEALAEINAGEGIEHSAVVAWAKSLSRPVSS